MRRFPVTRERRDKPNDVRNIMIIIIRNVWNKRLKRINKKLSRRKRTYNVAFICARNANIFSISIFERFNLIEGKRRDNIIVRNKRVRNRVMEIERNSFPRYLLSIAVEFRPERIFLRPLPPPPGAGGKIGR